MPGVDLFGLMVERFPSALPTKVEIVMRHKASRDLLRDYQNAIRAVHEGADPYVLADDMADKMRALGAYTQDPEAVPIDTFLDQSVTASPWIIPGILRADTKGLLIGPEGSGKMVQLRAMAMGLAQGVHPYTHKDIEPMRTLLVDGENSNEAIQETGDILRKTLRLRKGDAYNEDYCKIVHRLGGMRLRKRADRAAFIREIAAHRPALVCMGPLNKFHVSEKGESYEDAAAKTQQILDDIQAQYNFALVIEHHAPKGENGKRRELVPMGSQMWMGWPEFGIGLRPDPEDFSTLAVEHYRNPRVRLNWPTEIRRHPLYLVVGYWSEGRMP